VGSTRMGGKAECAQALENDVSDAGSHLI